jgi:hypothetical protein
LAKTLGLVRNGDGAVNLGRVRRLALSLLKQTIVSTGEWRQNSFEPDGTPSTSNTCSVNYSTDAMALPPGAGF